MDPTETLTQLLCALRDRAEPDEVNDILENLADWLNRGGFYPDVAAAIDKARSRDSLNRFIWIGGKAQ